MLVLMQNVNQICIIMKLISFVCQFNNTDRK